MAITVVGPVGLGGGKGAVSGISITAVTSYLPVVGDIFLTVAAIDNGGTLGVALDTTATFGGTGSVGTITDISVNRTSGASFDGCTLAIAYAQVTGNFSTDSAFSYSWTSGTIARAYGYYIISGAGPAHVNTANTTGTGSSPSIATGSSPTRATISGDVVFGMVAVESNTAITTGDADTTNGSWATYTNQASGGSGGDATKMSLGLQHKVTSGGDGTQTFNPTITSTDYAICVLTFGPVAMTTASAGLASGTGAASGQAGWLQPSAPVVSGTGVAQTATAFGGVFPPAGLVSGTGTAQTAATQVLSAGALVSGSGGAQLPTAAITVPVGP